MIVFGPFSLDAEKKILYRDDEILNISPKAFDVLAYLAARPGEVVSKNELMDEVWAGAFVEEGNLTHQIYEIRKILKTTPEVAIETLSRRGYRLKVPQSSSLNQTAGTRETEIVVIKPIVDLTRQEVDRVDAGGRRKWLAASIIGVLAIFLLVGSWVLIRRRAPRAPIRSIAVLPLKSLSGETIDDGLRMRLADSVITRLGTLSGVAVRPTSSVTTFLDSRAGVIDAGKQLGVDVVADGTLASDEGKLRVNIGLYSVTDGSEIWSEQFTGEPDKLLPLQDAIATRIVSHLNFRLSSEQSLALSGNITESPEAYEAYLRGRYFLTRRSAANILKAIDEFERAVILDPAFALAFAGLGDSYALLSVYDERPPKLAFPKAAEYARKALEIDPQLGEAYATLGFVAYRFDWNWSEAETHFANAIRLKPNYATAHHWRGELLNALGRFGEAEQSLRQALNLDPTSAIIATDLGYGLMLAGNFGAADAQLRSTLVANPDFPLAYYCLWDNQLQQNRRDDAARSFLAWMEKAGFHATEISLIRNAGESGGHQAFVEAQTKWAQTENARNYFTKFDFARFALARGDRDEAVKWLIVAAEEHAPDLIFIKVHPSFLPLRDDPRFIGILRQMNL